MPQEISDVKSTEKPLGRPPIYKYWWFWVYVGTIMVLITSALIMSLVGEKQDDDQKQQQQEEMARIKIREESEKKKNGEDVADPYWWSRELTENELAKANEAFSRGIKINDGQNDFYRPPVGTFQPDGRPDNPNPYPIPFTDLKSVSLGADNENLYIKYEFWGVFPEKMFTYQGEEIYSIGAKVAQIKYVTESGKPDQGDIGGSVIYYNSEAKGSFPIGRLLNEYRMSPTGKTDAEGDDIVLRSGHDLGAIFGGSGYDYIISMFPLSLFDIRIGTEITFEGAAECPSTTYHHEAIDNLGIGDASFSPIFKYVLGSNSYEVLPNPFNSKPAE